MHNKRRLDGLHLDRSRVLSEFANHFKKETYDNSVYQPRDPTAARTTLGAGAKNKQLQRPYGFRLTIGNE